MKKLIRNILKGTSLSTALFIFQACYGMPIGYDEYDLYFNVVDGETNNPIPDADVLVKENGSELWYDAGKTNPYGWVSIYNYDFPSIEVKFNAKEYEPKDTTITDLDFRKITIKLYKKQ